MILFIDTTSARIDLALGNNQGLLDIVSQEAKQVHSELILGRIDALLKDNKTSINGLGKVITPFLLLLRSYLRYLEY